MLDVQDITFSYKRAKVLDQVSLHVRQGDCVALVGVNGCGKTTLLSILVGARKCRKGKVTFLSKKLPSATKERLRLIGYVPQENPLMPDLSVRDNLRLWFVGDKKAFEKELKDGFLSALKMDAFLDKKVKHLSGGMKKRVSIGMALQNHPSMLILDEPGAALDLQCKEDIRSFLELYIKAGGTVLITTHEEAELSLCNRMYALRAGHIEEVDPSLRGDDLLRKLVTA